MGEVANSIEQAWKDSTHQDHADSALDPSHADSQSSPSVWDAVKTAINPTAVFPPGMVTGSYSQTIGQKIEDIVGSAEKFVVGPDMKVITDPASFLASIPGLSELLAFMPRLGTALGGSWGDSKWVWGKSTSVTYGTEYKIKRGASGGHVKSGWLTKESDINAALPPPQEPAPPPAINEGGDLPPPAGDPPPPPVNNEGGDLPPPAGDPPPPPANNEGGDLPPPAGDPPPPPANNEGGDLPPPAGDPPPPDEDLPPPDGPPPPPPDEDLPPPDGPPPPPPEDPPPPDGPPPPPPEEPPPPHHDADHTDSIGRPPWPIVNTTANQGSSTGSYTNTHSDVAAAHGDSHTDTAGSHADVAPQNSPGTSHHDEAHGDANANVPHGDSPGHADASASHTDQSARPSFVDGPTSTPHNDVSHVDSHSDTPHVDLPAHSHGDTSHQDSTVPHADTHDDTTTPHTDTVPTASPPSAIGTTDRVVAAPIDAVGFSATAILLLIEGWAWMGKFWKAPLGSKILRIIDIAFLIVVLSLLGGLIMLTIWVVTALMAINYKSYKTSGYSGPKQVPFYLSDTMQNEVIQTLQTLTQFTEDLSSWVLELAHFLSQGKTIPGAFRAAFSRPADIAAFKNTLKFIIKLCMELLEVLTVTFMVIDTVWDLVENLPAMMDDMKADQASHSDSAAKG